VSEHRQERLALYRRRLSENGIAAKESRNEGQPISKLYEAFIKGPTVEESASTEALMSELVLRIG
jgi:hypothetical protein